MNKSYDTVFLDVDRTLLWIDVDLAGYVEGVSPYSANGPLTVEQAAGPAGKAIRTHVQHNINYRTHEELEGFMYESQLSIARTVGVDAPPGVLTTVSKTRVRFNPYPETARALEELRELGLKLYVVSNWDILLEEVIEGLGWTRYFDGVLASRVVGIEKPDSGIFEEALRVSGSRRERVVHVGNDPVADVKGASSCGIDAVLVNRDGRAEAPEAVAVVPDLSGLPAWIGGRDV